MKPSARSSLLLIVALLASFSLACGVCTFSVPRFGPPVSTENNRPEPAQPQQVPETRPTLASVPTLPAAPQANVATAGDQLVQLYQQVIPGVVSINVQTQQGIAAGSGFIIDDQGHIATNNHVVLGANDVIVTFYNGLEARADVVGTDPFSDLAVIKVEQLPQGTHPLPLANSDDVKPGQQAIAIGNPFGEEGTMTAGIISAVGRTIPSLAPQFGIPLAIQTDAPINPGNSGGPLLNSAGQVIGVNSQLESGGLRANVGVGFAVPANIVRRVAPFLIKEGRYQWPWIGISGISMSLALADALNTQTEQGAYVVEVISGSPADRAGLQGAQIETRNGIQVPVGGDVIVEADGNTIRSWDDLLSYTALQQVGQTVNLTVLRNGKQITVPVELAARPQNLQPEQQTSP
ncbi:MAG: trypsin-like peptidase domain-containing protein [Ardenticatenaceae bacterium]|nr:trypsin-like peptidase domain-containing protein [Ardenticatenaceae bacterium]HBY99472.1 hypothetical protein [Chloroflexota bacterium]